MKKYLVSLIEEVVTEESAAYGNYESQEYVFDEEEMTIDEVIQEIRNGSWELCNGNGKIWLGSTDSEMNYLNGDQITYSLFIEGLTIEDLKKLKNHNDLRVLGV